MYTTLSASSKERFFTGGILLSSILISSIPVSFLLGSKFNLEMFFFSLTCCFMSGITCYFFFQSLFCPKVQVLKREIIIRGMKRIVIPRNSIKQCVVVHGDLIIVYGDDQKIRVSVGGNPSDIVNQLRNN
jgi:hypothetical protein